MKAGNKDCRGPRFYKAVLIALALIAAGLLFYWGKCQLGDDLIKGFSWEAHIPLLNAFQRQVPISHPLPGDVLVEATFDDLFKRSQWGKVYGPGKGLIKERIVPEGRAGTKALEIDNRAEGYWVKEYEHWVAVTPGEVFGHSGFCRFPASPSNQARVYMGVKFYNADHDMLKGSFEKSIADAKEGDGWQEMSGRLTVPPEVAFIRFRISGEKPGRVFFDDIKFWREK